MNLNTYLVKTINSKHYILTKNEVTLGDLKYKNRFSFKAQITLPSGSVYTLLPIGFFGNTVEIKDKYRVVMNLKQNWIGKMTINTLFENYNRPFILSRKGFFKSEYILCDMNNRVLLTLNASFSMKKFNYDYTLSPHPELDALDYKDVLLLTTIYCKIYYTRRDSTAIVT